LSSEASRSLPTFKDFHKGKIALNTAYYISRRERTARWRLLQVLNREIEAFAGSCVEFCSLSCRRWLVCIDLHLE
jgi:hypothetical protein